ncbi:nicotinate-nucleotide--dimethylbenzimidazole phosphoribosyltransferase [Carboxydothermus ferrireducens]|uniref:Nicotinate-nucleotide--dimethylbenzimidazole phosphoribosyltransferase n=1 Tax=Carboxydothermus ferrireducens DSM 11255 TaxID=1119529 RepID=A0ABX2R5C0_9THEO|nr:nicotinate-nucleotide--dimethylbenzimidazole phosphoribosyltransferase [Carboxydothermus ferrireducens]NYE56359.1 nicotinate-nucleotide--dimethylbenzimidazole phosphoribosyltransferase [Carboxydothermus ferrireducens DSM 11255]
MLTEVLNQIGELYPEPMEKAKRHLDSLIKPPGSLGVLEEMAVKLAGITGELAPNLSRKTVVVMAGDHGITEHGVSVAPVEVTAQMTRCFLEGIAGINVLSRHTGVEVKVVDMGVRAELNLPGLIVKKVRSGTSDFTQGPAMTREEALQAIMAGVEVARDLIAQGSKVLITGDMGIGNTTPSAAILAVLMDIPVEQAVGRGTGIKAEILQKKIEVIKKGLRINQPDKNDAVDVLAKVGGFEIGGLAGLILGAAARRVPVVIDGFISSAAAMLAVSLNSKTKNFLFPSHLSDEPGHKLMMEYLGLTPYLHLKMRLGEGTGGVFGAFFLEAATKVMREMGSFASSEVSALLEERMA